MLTNKHIQTMVKAIAELDEILHDLFEQSRWGMRSQHPDKEDIQDIIHGLIEIIVREALDKQKAGGSEPPTD